MPDERTPRLPANPGRTLLRRLAADASGVALIEFALVSSLILAILLPNIVDFCRLIWAKMQCDYAAQAGAQQMYKTCAAGTLPATRSSNCSYSSKLTTAIQGTALGTNLSLASGYPSEGYYCACASDNTNSCTTGTLTKVSTATPPTPPAPNCSGYSSSGSSITAGDYVQVNVSYSFAPLFHGASLATSQTVTGQSLIRLQ